MSNKENKTPKTPKTHGNKQAYRWLLTINNPVPEFTHQKIKEIFALYFSTFLYLAMCDEIGNEGHTYHTHIYVVFGSGVRFSTIKKYFPTAHIDASRGTIQHNLDYLRKTGKWADTEKAETSVEGTFEELGDKPPEYAGKRGDMARLFEMVVLEGMSNAEIIKYNPDYILQIDKLDKIRANMLYDRFRTKRRLNLKVTYIFGPTAVGKTRGILDKHGDQNVYRVTDEKHPFDEYLAEPVICFEEFRSDYLLKDMLNYLDVYVLPLPARYSNKVACYERVYIVSNWPLEYQYEYAQRHDKKSYAAFLSRIHEVVEYLEDGTSIHQTVSTYFERRKLKLPNEYKQRIPKEDTHSETEEAQPGETKNTDTTEETAAHEEETDDGKENA